MRVKAGWKLRRWWRSQGSSGGSREEAGRKAGGRSGDSSREGASGLQPLGVGAPGEEWLLVSGRARASARRKPGMTGSVSEPSVRLACGQTSLRRSPLARGCEQSLRGGRLGIVAGACGAQPQHHLGSGSPATEPWRRSGVRRDPAHASACVSGRRVKRRSAVREHHARESEHWWVLVTSGRLQRSWKGISCRRPRTLGCGQAAVLAVLGGPSP